MGLEKAKKPTADPMFDLGAPGASLSDKKAQKKKTQNLSKSTMGNDFGVIKRKTDMMMGAKDMSQLRTIDEEAGPSRFTQIKPQKNYMDCENFDDLPL